MKKSIIAIAALIVAGSAQAESSVTLYGLIDAGVTFVNNQGGDTNYRMDSGIMNGNRWGLKGREELNDNLAAIFRLESGFSLDNGNQGQDAQGRKIFGRQAYAGLDIKDVGAVTFGRQYDFMADIGDYTTAGTQFGSNYMLESSGVFHTDTGFGDRATGARLDNTIKFQSNNIGGTGITAGVMVGLGENAQNKKLGRSFSASVGFDGIPNFSTKLAYTQLRNTVIAGDAIVLNVSNILTPLSFVSLNALKTDIWGLGASYDLGFGKVNGTLTSTKVDFGGPIDYKANVYEAGYTHRISPQLSAGVGFQYFDNKTNGIKKLDMYGASFALDYVLSSSNVKRTDAYFLTVWDKAKSQTIAGNTVNIAPNITGTGASDSKNQIAVRVGLRHRF
jgi:predicted porin